MTVYNMCPVCGSPRIQPIFNARDHTVSQEWFPIMECQDCTLRFTDRVPGEDEIGAYYKSADYISHTDTSKGFINSIYHSVRRRTLQQKKDLIRRQANKESGTLLDLGCGTGAFLKVMQSSGWTVKGLEPDADARAIAASRGIAVADLPQFFQLPPLSFDVITLWHVLEHVHQLHRYVEQFRQLLAPDGLLVIAVPNYTAADAVHYGQDWAAYDVPRHLYHFSPASMRRLMQQHGLDIVEIKPMWFDSFYVGMLSEKNLGHGSMGLVKAVWQGMRSNWNALRNTDRCSSQIYLIRSAAKVS